MTKSVREKNSLILPDFFQRMWVCGFKFFSTFRHQKEMGPVCETRSDETARPTVHVCYTRWWFHFKKSCNSKAVLLSGTRQFSIYASYHKGTFKHRYSSHAA